MKRIFFSVSFRAKDGLKAEIKLIGDMVQKVGFKLFVFVDEYNFALGEETLMMKQSFSDIEKSEFVIAELSDKAIGVGIEIGYAVALKKQVFYLRKKGTDYSK